MRAGGGPGGGLLFCALLLVAAVATGEEETGEPTYSGEAGRILARRCVGCHRSGQPGRVPLDTWEQAHLFAREIRIAIGTRKMPPWPAVPEFGEFQNDRSLTMSEIETLLRWTDTGAKKGEGDGRLFPDIPASEPGDIAAEFALPEAYTVASAGDAESRCFSVLPNRTGGAWVRGIDVVPGDPRVVLYVRVFADPGRRGEQADRADPGSGYNCYRDENQSPYLERAVLGEWSPGAPLQLLPPGMARRLPPRTPIIVEIRYGRIGHAVVDRTRIRLLAATRPVRTVVPTQFVTRQGLQIPADTWSFLAEGEWIADRDTKLLSVTPAMSALGTDFKATVVLPDGTVRPLVWVHEYDQTSQISHVFRKPVRIPAGSRIRIRAEFDNFETNPKSAKGKAAEGGFSLAFETVSPAMIKAQPRP